MAELTISIFSHHFRLTRVTLRARPAVMDFARKFVQHTMTKRRGRFVSTATKTFALGTDDRQEFAFHINSYADFQEHLGYYHLRGDLVETIQVPEPYAVKTTYDFKEEWQPKPYQVPFLEYLDTLYPTSPRAKFGGIQTGKGKTYSSLRSMANKGFRGLIIVKGGFLDKWVDDVHKYMNLDVEDVMVIRGTNQLKALLHLAMAGEYKSKIVLMTSKIMQNWINAWKQYREGTVDIGYPCSPRQFCELLGVGERLIDEVHEAFHLWFMIDLVTHVKNSTSLSASFVSDDTFVQRMMDIMHPPVTRYTGDAYHKYVSAVAVFYRFKKPSMIRWKDPSTGYYSHHVFEQWILRDDELTANYLEFVDQLFIASFMQGWKEGDKALIYASSVDMCTVMTDYFAKKYPNMDVRRFTELDPYENVIDADLRISTLGKAGAAIDIKDLTTVILTNARRATASNIQGFGRLRELHDGRTPKFTYVVCEDIDKHVEYHDSKWLLLRDMALHLNTKTYGNAL